MHEHQPMIIIHVQNMKHRDQSMERRGNNNKWNSERPACRVHGHLSHDLCVGYNDNIYLMLVIILMLPNNIMLLNILCILTSCAAFKATIQLVLFQEVWTSRLRVWDQGECVIHGCNFCFLLLRTMLKALVHTPTLFTYFNIFRSMSTLYCVKLRIKFQGLVIG